MSVNIWNADTYLNFSHELNECILDRVIESKRNQEQQGKRRINEWGFYDHGGHTSVLGAMIRS